MVITQVKLIKLALPLRQPIQVSYGTLTHKSAILVVVADEAGHQGIGECSAFAFPNYTPDFCAGAWALLQQLAPRLLGRTVAAGPAALSQAVLGDVRGNHMAQAALDEAIWSLAAATQHVSLKKLVGGRLNRVPVTQSIGIKPLKQLADQAQVAWRAGIHQFKVKIKPGWCTDPVRVVRQAVPQATLTVDANGSFTEATSGELNQLASYNVASVEQPLPQGQWAQLSELHQHLRVPITLDESINSLADVQTLHALRAGVGFNLKLAKVGGITPALAIMRYATAHKLAWWVGGMYDTGVGRALSLAVASCAKATTVHELTPPQTYLQTDIIKGRLQLTPGGMRVPTVNGSGVQLAAVAADDVVVFTK